MRLVLGVSILLACFAAAALWQRDWTSAARSKRRAFPSSPDGRDPVGPGDGWSRVVLGRPSGGEPYLGPADSAAPTPPPSDSEEPRTPPRPTPPDEDDAASQDAEVIVREGQTLSEICRERYGSARKEIVLALARYNRLAEADDLREGQRLLLPPSEKLLEDR